MRIKLLVIILATLLFLSCKERKEVYKDYCIGEETISLTKGKTIFTKDASCYFYDLRVSDSFYLFLDKQSDTVLWIYRKNEVPELVMSIKRNLSGKDLYKPVFTKEVYPKDEKKDTFFLVDNNLYLKRLALNETTRDMELFMLSLFNSNRVYSTDFNITKEEIYAVPVLRGRKNPFYFFNPDSGYYWVDTPTALSQNMPTDAVSYTNSICVNENTNSVVSAFRFTNCLSFYQLDGTLRTTVQFGNDLIIPQLLPNQKELDVEGSIKCFIHICGTPRYVYCLYAGTNDFSGKSKILVFQWNGRHIKTWEVDRGLRTITVDKNDKYILGIASDANGGQDILQYELE